MMHAPPKNETFKLRALEEYQLNHVGFSKCLYPEVKACKKVNFAAVAPQSRSLVYSLYPLCTYTVLYEKRFKGFLSIAPILAGWRNMCSGETEPSKSFFGNDCTATALYYCTTVTVCRIREELELKCLPLPFHCHDPRYVCEEKGPESGQESGGDFVTGTIGGCEKQVRPAG